MNKIHYTKQGKIYIAYLNNKCAKGTTWLSAMIRVKRKVANYDNLQMQIV